MVKITSWLKLSLMLDGQLLLFFTKYKLAKLGGNYVEINRFYPSSKIHNVCGYVNQELTLKDREWFCPVCKIQVNRDLNAAINIKKSRLGQSFEPLELPTLVGALKKKVNNS